MREKENTPKGVDREIEVEDLIQMLEYYRTRILRFDIGAFDDDEYKKKLELICNKVFDETISILKNLEK